MTKTIYDVSAEMRLAWVERDLETLVNMIQPCYKNLLENPDFKYSEFQDIGGWPLMVVYKGILKALEDSNSTLDTQEALSWATKIEEIYYKRWENKTDENTYGMQ